MQRDKWWAYHMPLRWLGRDGKTRRSSPQRRHSRGGAGSLGWKGDGRCARSSLRRAGDEGFERIWLGSVDRGGGEEWCRQGRFMVEENPDSRSSSFPLANSGPLGATTVSASQIFEMPRLIA